MSRPSPPVIAFMFVCAAASVLVVGYRPFGRYPIATVLSCLAALAALGRWYGAARHGDDRTANLALRKLTFFLVALVLVVPYLLQVLLKR